MRITNNILLRRQLSGLQSNAQSLDRAQSLVSSGLKVTKLSDDPSAGGAIMATSSGLRAISQYRRNVEQAQGRIDVEDQVLQQITSALSRAKELGLSQAGSTSSAQSRTIAAKELEQIFNQVVSLSSAKFGDEFLFGGETSQVAPFSSTGTGATLDFAQTGGDGARSIEVGAGQRFAATHDGTTVFASSGVLASLRDLTRAMGTAGGDGSAIRDSLAALDDAFDDVQALIGDVGARANSLQMTAANLDAFEGGMKVLKSDLEDVDFEAAVTELVAKQTAYQAAMLASSKVLGLNLTDYLR
jgi:flagellar hook-associated protein 3 FlgL